MSRRLFCFGFGYTARALALRLAAEDWKFACTSRSDEQALEFEREGVAPALWVDDDLDARALDGADAILISAPPSLTQGCPAFVAASGAIASRAVNLSWIGYLSSNAVYGDRGGDWVDEDSTLTPQTDRGRARVAAEAQWAALAAAWDLPLAIFRLPGIYGPGRSAFDALREGRAQRIVKPGQVFNRMHVDDIAATLAASLEHPRAGDLFNLSDDEPSPPQDVIEYACGLLGVEPPPLVAFEHARLSNMARSFYAENKRVKNHRIKSALGVALRHPTYREGLDAIFRLTRNP